MISRYKTHTQMTSTSQTIKKKDRLSGRPSKGEGKVIEAHERARAREKEKGFPSLPLARPKIPLPFGSLPRRPRKR